MLLGHFWVLVVTPGALIFGLNPNLQHVHELVPEYRGQLLLDGLLQCQDPFGGIVLSWLQELLAHWHQAGHTLPQISETGHLVGLVAGQSPDNPQQSLAGRQCSQEVAESRARHQGIGATVGVANCAATVLQLEQRLLWWQPGLVPRLL